MPAKSKKAASKKPFIRRKDRRLSPNEVSFEPGITKHLEGGGRRLYWHIRVGGVEVGHAYIDVVPDAVGDELSSITVMLNAKSRGLGIGTIAFRRVAELSG